LAGNVVVVQVIGVYEIGRPQLNSNVAKNPIINATARSKCHSRVGCGNPVYRKIHLVSPNQAMHKARDLAGVISKIKTRPSHVGEIAAVQARIISAIAKLVAAEVSLNSQTMKQAHRGGKFPAV
jgi:hypothetical protein